MSAAASFGEWSPASFADYLMDMITTRVPGWLEAATPKEAAEARDAYEQALAAFPSTEAYHPITLMSEFYLGWVIAAYWSGCMIGAEIGAFHKTLSAINKLGPTTS